ncbi:MAG: HlyC/CorC family transporter [bacterium]|nr:HlyC/CorC family transporter [bacterium]
MDTRLVMELLAILVLVLANGFFALAEFSIIASRSSRLEQQKTEGKTGAAKAVKLRAGTESFLASIQVGITLVAALLGVFSGATMVAKLEPLIEKSTISFIAESATSISVAIVVLAITILSVVMGELVPKYIALARPERFARFIAAPISVFIAVTAPFSKLLSKIASLIVRALGVRRDGASQQITEEEINQMLLDGSKRGVFEATEQQFIRSVFEFTDSTVRRAMKPRPDVIAFERSCPSETIIETIVDNGYSRYPVYEETIDKVVGIIYVKDLIEKNADLSRIDLSSLNREPIFVPDSMPLPKLLRDFQQGKNHMAIVLDEFGGTAGIITLEDVLEELVGEIQDEYDAESAPLVKQTDEIAYAAGDVWPGDVNDLMNTHLPEDSFDTLAGLYMDTIGRLPVKNERLDIEDVRLTILAKDENRILRLKLERIARLTDEEDRR